MKIVKILGDDLNKFSDTSSVLRFSLLKDGIIQDVTGKTVSFTLANASGYLFDVTPVLNGTEVKLDFSDAKLKELTPDTYKFEINVTNADGDVEVYPSVGAVEFTVGRNLKSQTGTLVPQVTFDDVLKGVDEKVNHYISTIAKGDKGPKGDTGAQGPAGKDGVTPDIQVGGRNYILNSKEWPQIYTNLDAVLTTEKDENGNTVAHIVIPSDGRSGSGIYWFSKTVNKGEKWTLSIDVKGTAPDIDAFNLEPSDDIDKLTSLDSENWTRMVATGISSQDGSSANVIYFNPAQGAVDVYVRLPKLELGTIPTDWTPAPEDKADDDAVLHNTGNETATGNKTLLGETTLLLGNSGFRITTMGFEKSTDGGKTWVTANI